jgi:hypothetical protein
VVATDAEATVHVLACAELDTVPAGTDDGANEAEIAFVAQLDVPTKVPVNEPLNEPVLICSELDTVPLGSTVGANEELIANEAVVARDDDTAQLLVPTRVPVNEPLKLPVLICVDEDTNPVGLLEMVSQLLAAPDT